MVESREALISRKIHFNNSIVLMLERQTRGVPSRPRYDKHYRADKPTKRRRLTEAEKAEIARLAEETAKAYKMWRDQLFEMAEEAERLKDAQERFEKRDEPVAPDATLIFQGIDARGEAIYHDTLRRVPRTKKRIKKLPDPVKRRSAVRRETRVYDRHNVPECGNY